VLDVDGEPRELTYAELGPGKVQIEFKRMDEVEFDDEPDDDDADDDDADDDDADDDDEGEGEEK
jgi:ribosome maturation factor RimP